MKRHLISAVSAIAVMLSFSPVLVHADQSTAVTDAHASAGRDDGSVSHEIKEGLVKANNGMADAANDIHAWFVGKDKEPGAKLEPVLIHRNNTARGLIGEKVVNPKGEKVGTLKDIIVDKDGEATLAVVSDGGLLGIGSKVAAFDFNKVAGQETDGKIVMTLSQDMIDHAADFSYDQKDWAKAKVIPAGSISVTELLDGKVLDSNDKKVASIENVYIRHGDVSKIIVGFDKTLGMGGNLAALNYNDLQVVKPDGDKDDVDVKLSDAQSAQFRDFKKSVEN